MEAVFLFYFQVTIFELNTTFFKPKKCHRTWSKKFTLFLGYCITSLIDKKDLVIKIFIMTRLCKNLLCVFWRTLFLRCLFLVLHSFDTNILVLQHHFNLSYHDNVMYYRHFCVWYVQGNRSFEWVIPQKLNMSLNGKN